MSEADSAGRPVETGAHASALSPHDASSVASTGQSPAAVPPSGTYRVLARKYRPATFDDLIGQDAMVRTISNAFATGRIPQAWILTGVRGVGKTTTARILARGLNYELPDRSVQAPTIRMPVPGLHCAAIIESRHVDVLEMDAASHNGVDDIRQINDAVRYAPAYARYKVYILDEVHMLSTAAFNALLKTLEEPPPHAKFVFATTEIRAVPVTVLSRCQRFDLRRVEADRLVAHFEAILAKEGAQAEPEALALIARAAEGSVRDGLSLIDQAISHAAGPIRAEDVRQMLGLADRGRIIDLFDALMRGDIARALSELRDQYQSGADPFVVLGDLAEFTHFVTRVKVVPAVAEDRSLAEVERRRGRDFAAALSMPLLSRTWQMLFKGLAEVKEAPRPLAAAEMVLVRIAYAANLPSPEDVVRALGETPARSPAPVVEGAKPLSHGRRDERGLPGSDAAPPAATIARAVSERRDSPRTAPAPSAPASQPSPAPAPRFTQFEELIAFAGEKRELALKMALERDLRLVSFEDGKLEIALEPRAPPSLATDLSRRLAVLTGRRWMVALSAAPAQPSMKTQIAARHEAFRQGVQANPLVQKVLARFPGAEIVAVRQPQSEIAEPASASDEEGVGLEMPTAEEEDSAFGAHRLIDDVDDDF